MPVCQEEKRAITQTLSKQLHSLSPDFEESRHFIDSCTAKLQESARMNIFKNIWSEVCETADKNGPEKPKEHAEKDDRKRDRHPPQNLAGSVTNGTTEHWSVDEAVDMQTLYHQKLFAVIDSARRDEMLFHRK